ncbi:MAG: Gfo/Idh/MocA family oxidoreductase, partial [Candidatus Brocadiia bacterium]|nr:Gfo/Idh/MocA family oxidoreductase [Candidatus Brocadiia bacterium]
AELVAVGSRTQEKADAFADEFGAPRRHASYEALAADPDVDIVYVATPHPQHKPCSMLCLEAGKAVLCEKPLTVNAAEAEELVACARGRGLFLMEAMWTRFFPLMDKVRELLAADAIGEARMLQVDLGFRADFDPASRLFNPLLAGGALLDVGVYCVALSSMVFGEPSRAMGLAHLAETGVDEQAAWVFQYDRGQLAVGYCAMRTGSLQEVTILGTEGSIRIHSRFEVPELMTVRTAGGEEEMEFPFEGTGMAFEAAAVSECLRDGRLEHELMPLDESIAIMRTMDALRAQWGVKYPME